MAVSIPYPAKMLRAARLAYAKIIGAYKHYKNGLRPSPDAKKPWLLKDVVTIHFQVFACLGSEAEASDGSCTYFETDLGLMRAPRQMLARLDPADVDLSACVDMGRLTLTSHGGPEARPRALN